MDIIKRYSLLCCLLCICRVFAQAPVKEIGLQVDNDSFLAKESDKYYTNGMFIYYNVALKIKKKNTQLANKVLNLEAGQKIFTPFTALIQARQAIDRPFAGYLYIGTAINLLYKNESTLKLQVQAGVTGAAAQGEQVQQFIHRIFKFPAIEGWVFQIKNDAELNLSAAYNKLLVRNSWADASLCTYVNLGNGFTGAGAGAMFRIGNFNRLFNSVSTQSSAIQKNDAAPLHKKELFFYYKPKCNVIIYDATIQGSLFRQHNNTGYEVTLHPEPLMLSQECGFSYAANRAIINLSAIFCTRDVKEMKYTHQWGSVALFYRVKK